MPTIILVEEGDVATFRGDAVVNAANNHLVMGEGVGAALLKRGGPSIQVECDEHVRRNGPLALGDAAVTGAGSLGVRWVIHAAATGDERTSAEAIRRATRSALERARGLGVSSMAFPVLGMGAAGFPFEEAARLMVDEIRAFTSLHQTPDSVVLYGYRPEQARFFRRLLV